MIKIKIVEIAKEIPDTIIIPIGIIAISPLGNFKSLRYSAEITVFKIPINRKIPIICRVFKLTCFLFFLQIK
ncbi:hypothetical protein C1634_021090 [Chryseobacterium viscerum]|uniref:Uncharacterized protein n=1 Tax=Chryseobacterium viscerum TaxID=1037377 RepID=A0A316WKZ5_9FLAO|nr:hypothetical protein C1634_021090 [Chryseobacterium viscerum]